MTKAHEIALETAKALHGIAAGYARVAVYWYDRAHKDGEHPVFGACGHRARMANKESADAATAYTRYLSLSGITRDERDKIEGEYATR